ncbi:MAG: hypothetical protein Q4P34_04570 [Tissierellia bacterium]|nr:hypothetical protein [Tissierellia bacterium]
MFNPIFFIVLFLFSLCLYSYLDLNKINRNSIRKNRLFLSLFAINFIASILFAIRNHIYIANAKSIGDIATVEDVSSPLFYISIVYIAFSFYFLSRFKYKTSKALN